MALSRSLSLSLLIKWKKGISVIHRNFERIKLGYMNEKTSEIIKCMQTDLILQSTGSRLEKYTCP